MANIFKGIESFLGKGAKATSEEIGGFINKTLKGANKAIEELSSSEGLISKEIEAFQKDFREGIVNGADNAGDLAKELEYHFDDVENDELLCASYFVGRENDFVLIHEGFDFCMDSLRLLENRFHTKIYLEGSDNVYEIKF